MPALSSRIADVPQPKATDSDTERYLLFTAVVGLLAEVSADEPVVLIFDDLQWADSGSLLLLRHLATTELPMRVLILATLRDHELPNTKELRDTVGELWRQRRVSRLELEGLNHGDVVSYMEAAAGHKLDKRRASRSRTQYIARPTETRSSSARCSATWPKPEASTRTWPGSGCPLNR